MVAEGDQGLEPTMLPLVSYSTPGRFWVMYLLGLALIRSSPGVPLSFSAKAEGGGLLGLKPPIAPVTAKPVASMGP